MLSGFGVDFDSSMLQTVRYLAVQRVSCIQLPQPKIHGRTLVPGEVGNALSHIYLYRAFLETDRQELLVLEDDAEIGVALLQVLRARGNFPPLWELINFVSDASVDVLDVRIWDIHRASVFRGNANRTACYLINRKGAARLLAHALPVRFAADGLTGRTSETGLVSYGCWPPVAGLSGEMTTIKEPPESIGVHRRLFTRLARVIKV